MSIELRKAAQDLLQALTLCRMDARLMHADDAQRLLLAGQALRSAIQQAEAQQPATPESAELSEANDTKSKAWAWDGVCDALNEHWPQWSARPTNGAACATLAIADMANAASTQPAPSVTATGEPTPQDVVDAFEKARAGSDKPVGILRGVRAVMRLLPDLKPAPDPIAPATPNVDVRTILLAIVPGDGNGEEVYAESVDDVVAKMTELSEREESLRTQVDLLTAAVEARGREIAKLKATTAPVADGVPDGVRWFTVTQDGMPDFGEEVIGGFWYTDPWLKPDCATRFMWGQCRVVKDDHRDFKDGKRWQTFGPSHNDITHWARLKSPAHHTANHESQNGE